MASLINASTTGLGGIITTGDNSGSLALQTGGTTALTIDTSQNVSINPGSLLLNGASAATTDSKINTQITTAGSFLTLAEFRNLDYTSGTRSFIRVRNAVSSGSSGSAYFGQGQDNKLYLIANNSARGGDLVIDGGTGYVGLGTTTPSVSLDLGSKTDAILLPNGTTAQRPASPVAGYFRYNTTTTTIEYYGGGAWVGIGLRDGSAYGNAAYSAAAIKALVGNPSSGVYWLQVPNVNGGAPFKCWCDFTINGGIGYAIVSNTLFTGSQTGPSWASMSSTSLTGTADKFSNYAVAPTTMFANYNNGAGITKLAVFATRNDGTTADGIQSSSTYRWVAFSGVSVANYVNIWTNGYSSNQFTGSFVTADGNTGTAYFPNSHGSSGGVTQISTNGGTVNDYILYEYNPNGGSDPNHFWEVNNGRSGDTYFVNNGTYGSNSGNTLYTRWGGVAIY